MSLADELNWRSATELACLIRSKTVTSVELLRSCLETIERLNPKINDPLVAFCSACAAVDYFSPRLLCRFGLAVRAISIRRLKTFARRRSRPWSLVTSRKYARFTRNSESMKRGPSASVSMKGLCQFVPRSSLIDPCMILAAQLPGA